MDNLAFAYYEHESKEDKPFIVDNDDSAEWCIRKINEANKKIEDWTKWYQEQLEKQKQQCANEIAYFEGLLAQYFQTVPHKETKTQESYKLPSGTLKLKYPQPEFKRDDEKLINWLKYNQQNNFIKVYETPDWAELKKVVTVQGNCVVDSDGVIVEGITVEERDPVFEVEAN